MNRRSLFRTLAATAAGALTTKAALASAGETRDAAPASAEPQTVVYHLSESERVAFSMGNIRNHIAGMGGPDAVKIAVVVHGPAVRPFRSDASWPGFQANFNGLREAGVNFFICVNTLRDTNLTVDDLLPGFAVAERGGVVKLAELQKAGYAYLRP